MTERQPGPDAFERTLKDRFDDSVSRLDGATLSRLSRARQKALATPRRPTRPIWATASAIAALLVLALGLWQVSDRNAPTAAAVPTAMGTTGDQATDMEIVLSNENLDMVSNLEFYQWVGDEDANG